MRIPAFIWIILVILALIIAYILLIVVGNNRQTPSRVDASPIAELTEGQIARIEDVWVQFEESEFINNFRMTDLPHNRYTARSYSFDWRRRGSASMRVRISVSRDEEQIIDLFQLATERMDRSDHERYVYVANENGTEVILYYVFTDMPYFVPSFDRSIRTDIRIGNVVIRLRETRQAGNLRNDYSSQFIALLVEMLQNMEDLSG